MNRNSLLELLIIEKGNGAKVMIETLEIKEPKEAEKEVKE